MTKRISTGSHWVNFWRTVILISTLSNNRKRHKKVARDPDPLLNLETPQILRRENSFTGEPETRNRTHSKSRYHRYRNTESIRSRRMNTLDFDSDIEDRSFFIYMVVFPLINIAICIIGAFTIMQSYSKFDQMYSSSDQQSFNVFRWRFSYYKRYTSWSRRKHRTNGKTGALIQFS